MCAARPVCVRRPTASVWSERGATEGARQTRRRVERGPSWCHVATIHHPLPSIAARHLRCSPCLRCDSIRQVRQGERRCRGHARLPGDARRGRHVHERHVLAADSPACRGTNADARRRAAGNGHATATSRPCHGHVTAMPQPMLDDALQPTVALLLATPRQPTLHPIDPSRSQRVPPVTRSPLPRCGLQPPSPLSRTRNRRTRNRRTRTAAPVTAAPGATAPVATVPVTAAGL